MVFSFKMNLKYTVFLLILKRKHERTVNVFHYSFLRRYFVPNRTFLCVPNRSETLDGLKPLQNHIHVSKSKETPSISISNNSNYLIIKLIPDIFKILYNQAKNRAPN